MLIFSLLMFIHVLKMHGGSWLENFQGVEQLDFMFWMHEGKSF